MIEGYKTVNELAEEWGVNPRTIQTMCSDGRIPGAVIIAGNPARIVRHIESYEDINNNSNIQQ